MVIFILNCNIKCKIFLIFSNLISCKNLSKGAAYLRTDRNVGNVTAPIDFDNHVISGEINSRGKGVGGHSSLTPTVRIDMDLEVTSNGVRKNNISIFDIENNQWVQKTYRREEPALNTMFPEWWTGNRIKVEKDAAYKLRTQHPTNQSKWEGITPSGIKVEGFEYPRTTVFPKKINKKGY